jgi:hypothetical protein
LDTAPSIRTDCAAVNLLKVTYAPVARIERPPDDAPYEIHRRVSDRADFSQWPPYSHPVTVLQASDGFSYQSLSRPPAKNWHLSDFTSDVATPSGFEPLTLRLGI